MRKRQRRAAVGALAALTFSLAACGDDDDDDASDATTSAAPAPTSEAAAANDGVTQTSDIFGPGCSAVPTAGEGSAQGMVDDPVGTAAGNNPLVSTLVQAVTAANLVDTLNDPNASYTVFAPANTAFEKIPPETLTMLLADPQGELTEILTYHLIPERYDAEGIVSAGSLTSVQGGAVQIGGTADAPTVNGNQVLCGNIPTANATVFVIDTVLMPPA